MALCNQSQDVVQTLGLQHKPYTSQLIHQHSFWLWIPSSYQLLVGQVEALHCLMVSVRLTIMQCCFECIYSSGECILYSCFHRLWALCSDCAKRTPISPNTSCSLLGHTNHFLGHLVHQYTLSKPVFAQLLPQLPPRFHLPLFRRFDRFLHGSCIPYLGAVYSGLIHSYYCLHTIDSIQLSTLPSSVPNHSCTHLLHFYHSNPLGTRLETIPISLCCGYSCAHWTIDWRLEQSEVQWSATSLGSVLHSVIL